RMREPEGEVTVIREEQQPCRVRIQPTHWKQPVAVASLVADQVEHGRAGGLVLGRGDDTQRLVENDVAVLCRGFDDMAVDRDDVGLRIDENARRWRPLPVRSE